MERVFRGGTVVKAIEDTRRSAVVMQHHKLRGVEKASRSLEVERYEVAGLLCPVSHGRFLTNRAECSIRCIERAGRLLLAQSRLSDGANDQARLVSILGRRCAGDYFKGLNRARRQLRGKSFALLIRDYLVINRVRCFRVITERVKKPVRVGNNSRRRERHDVAQAGARRSYRQPSD